MTDKEITAELSGVGCAVYQADHIGGNNRFGPATVPEGPDVAFDLIQRFPTRIIVIKLIITTAGPIVKAITVVGVEITRRKSPHHSWRDNEKDVWTPRSASVPRAVRNAIDRDFRHAWSVYVMGYVSDIQRAITGKKGERPGYQEPPRPPEPEPEPTPAPKAEVIH